jgi:hypothetical protein
MQLCPQPQPALSTGGNAAIADNTGNDQAPNRSVEGRTRIAGNRRPMNRTVNNYQIKTLSQYPLLIGEILRRSDERRLRRAKW